MGKKSDKKEKFQTEQIDESPRWMSVIIVIIALVIVITLAWNGFQGKAITAVTTTANNNTKSIAAVTTTANNSVKAIADATTIAENAMKMATTVDTTVKINANAINTVIAAMDSMEQRVSSLESANAGLKNGMAKLESGRWNAQSQVNAGNRQKFETMLGYSADSSRVLANQLALTAPSKRDQFMKEIYASAPNSMMTQVQASTADIIKLKVTQKEYESHVREHDELIRKAGEKFFKKKK